MVKYNVWFTSDLHFSHKNILKYTDRIAQMGLDVENVNLEEMNQWIIDKWNSRIQKKDIVYILGDFSFANPEETKKILEKLKGEKHLIRGNHDGSLRGLENYFVSSSDIKETVFKKNNFDFLEENIGVIMCHYPMLTWNGRMYGTLMLHGHCHGSLDAFNSKSEELRLDIGIDGKLANYDIVSLEQVYTTMKNISQNKPFKEYVEELSQKIKMRY